jgi:hypothetical protein
MAENIIGIGTGKGTWTGEIITFIFMIIVFCAFLQSNYFAILNEEYKLIQGLESEPESESESAIEKDSHIESFENPGFQDKLLQMKNYVKTLLNKWVLSRFLVDDGITIRAIR